MDIADVPVLIGNIQEPHTSDAVDAQTVGRNRQGRFNYWPRDINAFPIAARIILRPPDWKMVSCLADEVREIGIYLPPRGLLSSQPEP